jgi:hypothetical protein
MHYPAKRVPELERMLEAMYRQWMEVLWRRQVLISCNLINNFFTKKIQFLFGQTIISAGKRIVSASANPPPLSCM